MQFFLEIDYQTLHHLNEKARCLRRITEKDQVRGTDRVIISFVQLFSHPNGYPLGMKRFSITVDWDMIFVGEIDPTTLRVFVEYDQQALFESGFFFIKEVGFCTADYRPSKDEVMEIYTLPQLMRMDASLKASYDQVFHQL